MPHPLDDIAPTLARWLAPYVAAELEGRAPAPSVALSPDYDEQTCAAFLAEIGDPVLDRAEVFFRALDEKAKTGQPGLDSLELVERLDELERGRGRSEVRSPRMIASLLTNSLKRRAKTLALPRPWTEGITHQDRTLWSDRDGISTRMVFAIADEELRRYPHPADESGGPRNLEVRKRLAGEEA